MQDEAGMHLDSPVSSDAGIHAAPCRSRLGTAGEAVQLIPIAGCVAIVVNYDHFSIEAKKVDL